MARTSKVGLRCGITRLMFSWSRLVRLKVMPHGTAGCLLTRPLHNLTWIRRKSWYLYSRIKPGTTTHLSDKALLSNIWNRWTRTSRISLHLCRHTIQRRARLACQRQEIRQQLTFRMLSPQKASRWIRFFLRNLLTQISLRWWLCLISSSVKGVWESPESRTSFSKVTRITLITFHWVE